MAPPPHAAPRCWSHSSAAAPIRRRVERADLSKGPARNRRAAARNQPGRTRGRCSPGCVNLQNGGRADPRRQWLGPLTTDGLPCGEHLTHQLLLGTLRRPMTRPIMHSHLTEHAAVARATAGKVLASRCARWGQSTRRGISSPPMKRSTSTTWSPVRATGSSSSSSCQRGYQPSPSRSGWPGAAWMACADKAHQVDGDGGAEAC